MAHGFRRGQAAMYRYFTRYLQDYLGGMGPDAQFQDLLKTLYEAQEPMLIEAVGKFGHQAAGLGQAPAGEAGWSGAAFGGLGDIYSKFRSDVLGQALQTYTAPFGSLFGQQIQPYPTGGGAGGLLGGLAGIGLGAFGGSLGGKAGGALGGKLGGWLGGMF